MYYVTLNNYDAYIVFEQGCLASAHYGFAHVTH